MSGYWIQRNEKSRSPNRMIFLSIASQAGRLQNSQTFAGAVTRQTRRYDKSGLDAPVLVTKHSDRVAMWKHIGDFTRKRERTVLVAHNLSEQLRLGMMLEIMPELGFTIKRFSLHVENAVVSMERDGATLIMIDAKSWLPTTIQKIASYVDIELSNAPLPTAPLHERMTYAESVCEILDLSIGGLRTWIKDADMGNWKPTGAGMAWANWRHSHYTHRVLAGGDPANVECEALSVGAGRAEAWRWGMQTEPPYIEWDLPLAYPRVALDAALPVSFFGETRNLKLDLHLNHSEKRRTLIHANVHQDVPVLGVKLNNRWCWAVGDIQGWWWDDELRLAREHGAEIKINRALTYAARPVLHDWAQWAIDFIESPTSPATPLQRAAVKHWSRSLIGRFGLRYEDWKREDLNMEPGIYTSFMADMQEDTTYKLMQIGTQTWLSNERKYSSEAVPSIMSAIMSECRIRLWRLMNIAGLDHVIYVDTDSLICDQIGSDRLAAYVASGGGWGIRAKHVHDSLEILGVRQLITSTDRKIAGVPTTAKRTGEREFTGQVVVGLTTALSRKQTDVVHSPQRKFNLINQDFRRLHISNGQTLPYALTQDDFIEDDLARMAAKVESAIGSRATK